MCPECDERFATIQEWKEHMETIHQRTLTSPFHDYDVRALVKLRRLPISGDTLYKCEHCGKAFGWRKYLRQHIREEHPGTHSFILYLFLLIQKNANFSVT